MLKKEKNLTKKKPFHFTVIAEFEDILSQNSFLMRVLVAVFNLVEKTGIVDNGNRKARVYRKDVGILLGSQHKGTLQKIGEQFKRISNAKFKITVKKSILKQYLSKEEYESIHIEPIQSQYWK